MKNITYFAQATKGDHVSWGVGKVEVVDNVNARVSYFDSPLTEPKTVHIPVMWLRRHSLDMQTRIYWQDRQDGTWRVGRVLESDEQDALVKFPNDDERYIPLEELHVRWNRPLDDPTAFLAQKINETPLFADARSGFVSTLTKQRSACQGMSALLSSMIELEHHQVDVVRRVLQDPEQRYLLADEVGLGKTIEAGVLIRQYVIDNPDNHAVLVLVPPALVTQWHDELTRRFLLHRQLGESVLVQPTTIAVEKLSRVLQKVGMLVVDEAHHLSHDRPLFEALRSAAFKIPRLLLLSATPVLHNERSFLEMLHLLDPLVYSLKDGDSFRQRIEHRQALAEIVAGLVPENMLSLDMFLDDLDENFPDDALLQGHVNRLRECLEDYPEDTEPVFHAALNTLRAHLSETYRLDRRILRNRRKGVHGLTPTRSGMEVIEYASLSRGRLQDALEAWRSFMSAKLYGDELGVVAKAIADWFSVALENSLANYQAIIEQVRKRQHETDLEEGKYLQEIVAAVHQLADDESRFSCLSKWIGDQSDDRTKYVIFCSQPVTADQLAHYLKMRVGQHVDRHVQENDQDSIQPPWTAFLDDAQHRILVCDRNAEEGLNLQGGDKVIVHFDLPLSPNRIEQRIGRVDRYGTGASIRSIILCCRDDQLESAWLEFLNRGLEVFHRSIASLQYLIEEMISGLRGKLLIEGLDAIQTLTRTMQGEDGYVARELRRIDEQDALDALATPEESEFEELDDIDSDWKEIKQCVDYWLYDTLLLGKAPGPRVGEFIPSDAVFRLAWQRGGHGRRTLVPLSKVDMSFLYEFDLEAPESTSKNMLTYPYTYQRRVALMQRARTNGVRLLRLGEPILERFREIMERDDRGRCFAMWRKIPGYLSELTVDLFLRFDFIVEADITSVMEIYSEESDEARMIASTALSRRGDRVFPPFVLRVWLDESLKQVENPETLEILTRPYRKSKSNEEYCDCNLNRERWQHVSSLGLPIMEVWTEFVTNGRERAEHIMEQLTELEKRSQQGVDRAREIDEIRFAQLRTRIHKAVSVEAEELMRLLGLEKNVSEALYDGILSPHISLDTIGAVFVSGQDCGVER